MAVIYALLRVRLNNVQNVFVHQKINHRRNRHYFSANGPFLLLPLALKWGLLSLLAMVIVPCINAKGVSAASLTLEIPTTPLTLDISPSENGTFSKSSPATIKVSTNALAGYSLSIKAKNDSDLINTSTNDKIVSITGDVAENIFNTSANYNNKYGFTFGKSGTLNTANSTFHSGVNTVIATTDGPNAENNAYDIVLGARVSNTIAAVQYSNTFVVMTSANPVPYNITYNANTEDKVDGMPKSGSEDAGVEGIFTIPTNEPQRDGYKFIGWCDGEETKEETGVDICSNGKSYQPEDKYTLSTTNQSIVLLAMWAKNSQIMQNWVGCEIADKNEQITLVDVRDNRPYYVAKLADGNCWMTENLDLFIDKNRVYTPEDTDVKKEWSPSESTHNANDYEWNVDYAIGSKGLTQPQSYDPGNKCWKGLDSSGSSFSSEIVDCTQHDSSHYHLGNYYNYSAGVAQNDTGDLDQDEESYDTSICPAGWKLPGLDGYESLYQNTDFKSGLSGNAHKAPYYSFKHGWYQRTIRAVGTNACRIVGPVSSSSQAYQACESMPIRGTWVRLDGLAMRCVVRQ